MRNSECGVRNVALGSDFSITVGHAVHDWPTLAASCHAQHDLRSLLEAYATLYSAIRIPHSAFD